MRIPPSLAMMALGFFSFGQAMAEVQTGGHCPYLPGGEPQDPQ
jgi:hypothetical protein